MLLLVSHFATNKGVTDFFVDYLIENNKDFYLFKHPFSTNKTTHSELLLRKNGQWKTIKTYKRSKSEILNLIKNFLTTVWMSLRLGSQIDTTYSFGSLNASANVLSSWFLRRTTVFWGVDYSRNRFTNKILNLFYHITETFACRFSTYTISQSERQQIARMQYHGLKKSRAILSANGVDSINYAKDFGPYTPPALLYLGSITKQHGVVDFVKASYVQHDIDPKLYIIGTGDKEQELLSILVANSKAADKVQYVGYLNHEKIGDWISAKNERLFGIAPYSNNAGDHVYYVDSLKVKEYLSYNIPYIASNVISVPEDLRSFGILYHDDAEFRAKINEWTNDFKLDIGKKNKALANYMWESLFTKVFSQIKS